MVIQNRKKAAATRTEEFSVAAWEILEFLVTVRIAYFRSFSDKIWDLQKKNWSINSRPIKSIYRPISRFISYLGTTDKLTISDILNIE